MPIETYVFVCVVDYFQGFHNIPIYCKWIINMYVLVKINFNWFLAQQRYRGGTGHLRDYEKNTF